MLLLSFLGYFDFGNAVIVATTFKIGAEKFFEHIDGQGFADDAATHDQHVGVIMLARELGFEAAATESGPDAMMAVGGYRNAYSGATDKQPQRTWVSNDVGSDGVRVIRVVTGSQRVGTKVFDLVTEFVKPLYQRLLQFKAAMIRTCVYLHQLFLHHVRWVHNTQGEVQISTTILTGFV